MTDERDSIEDYYQVDTFANGMIRFNRITGKILKKQKVTKQEAWDSMEFLGQYEEQIRKISIPWLERAGLPPNIDRFIYMIEGHLKNILDKD